MDVGGGGVLFFFEVLVIDFWPRQAAMWIYNIQLDGGTAL